MEEIWRDIEGYEGYQVSNLGNVKNLGSKWHPGEHLMSKHLNNKNCYLYSDLSKNGKKKTLPVHRLVAKAFPEICGEWFEGCEIDHIDTVRDNNIVTNLRVCTRKENNNNPLTKTHMSESRKGVPNNSASKLLSKPLSAYRYPSKEFVGSYQNARVASEEFGISTNGINKCCNGKVFVIKGLIFLYNTVSDVDNTLNERIEKCGKKQVMQFTLDGEYIKTFDSITDAAIHLRLTDWTNITRCCKGERKKAYNYIWKYVN